MNPDPKPDKPVKLKGKAYDQLQQDVLDRDRNICRICKEWTDAPPHHVVPRSQGGSDSIENLITCCTECHMAIHHGSMVKLVRRIR